MNNVHVQPRSARAFIIVGVGMILVIMSISTVRADVPLNAGSTLASGSQMTSGDYSLKMQADGNLVIYWQSTAIWSPMIFNSGSRLVMQTDGNLVVRTPSNSAVWNTGTAGSGANQAVLHTVGEFDVRYSGSVKWKAGTKGFGYIGIGAVGRPNNTNHTWYFGIADSAYLQPVTLAMANLDSQTEFQTSQVSQPGSADVLFESFSNSNRNIYAETYCVGWLNSTTCDQERIDVNLALSHPDKQSLMCHEIGHTVLLDDVLDGATNDRLLPIEKSCMRSGVDVRQYGIRHVTLINGLY